MDTNTSFEANLSLFLIKALSYAISRIFSASRIVCSAMFITRFCTLSTAPCSNFPPALLRWARKTKQILARLGIPKKIVFDLGYSRSHSAPASSMTSVSRSPLVWVILSHSCGQASALFDFSPNLLNLQFQPLKMASEFLPILPVVNLFLTYNAPLVFICLSSERQNFQLQSIEISW